MHNPNDRTIGERNEASSVSPGSVKTNVIEVRRSDYEVFEALDNDTRDGWRYSSHLFMGNLVTNL